MQKLVFLILLSIPAISCLAKAPQESNYIKCLAQEEARIHKSKSLNAYAELNKTLLSEVVQLSTTVRMDKGLEKIICSSKNKTPSYDLLGNLLIGVKVFHSTAHFRDIKQTALDNSTIKELTKQSNYIFIRFITNLQADSSKAYCLKKKFPKLRDFLYKAQYTLENIGITQLKSEISDLKGLFKRLRSTKALDDC